MINGLFVIMVYFLFVSISMFFINNQYILFNRGEVKNKINTLSIVFIGALFTTLNWLCTVYFGKGMLGSDRINYSFEFTGARSVGSIGLQLVFDIFARLGGNIYLVFYFTTFTCVLILLFTYRKSKMITPRVLLLFFIYDYIFFTFTGLKQAYSVAISIWFIVNLFEDDSKKGNILSIVLLFLACLFHSSAFVLVPIFVIYKYRHISEKVLFFIIMIITMVIYFLPQIMLLILPVVSDVLPILSAKIVKYFASDLVNDNWTTVFKYVPFFYITIWGGVNRRRLRDSQNYSTLLTISFLGLLLVVFSIKVYWFQRLRYYFYMPTFLLYDSLLKNEKISGNRIINNSIVCGGILFFMIREVMLIFVKWGAF